MVNSYHILFAAAATALYVIPGIVGTPIPNSVGEYSDLPVRDVSAGSYLDSRDLEVEERYVDLLVAIPFETDA